MHANGIHTVYYQHSLSLAQTHARSFVWIRTRNQICNARSVRLNTTNEYKTRTTTATILSRTHSPKTDDTHGNSKNKKQTEEEKEASKKEEEVDIGIETNLKNGIVFDDWNRKREILWQKKQRVVTRSQQHLNKTKYETID